MLLQRNERGATQKMVSGKVGQVFRTAKFLLTALEMEVERNELRKQGLTEEEIEGYFEYYIDNYLDDLQTVNE